MIFESYQYNRNEYVKMEELLKYINGNCVSLNDSVVRNLNPTLRTFLDVMISTMRRVSPLFDNMYETILYGGSFYDGLKIGKPDEFDIDLQLRLPNILNVQIIQSCLPGFVHVKLQDWTRLVRDRDLYLLYHDLELLKDDDNYLLQSNVIYWMMQTVLKAINIIRTEELLPNIFILNWSVHGPAVTLKIMLENKRVIDIDLVAVFRIDGSKWPGRPYRQNTSRIYREFYVVPKPPKLDNIQRNYWRLSFQQQEQELLSGYYFCKPALRLLKKLRDTRTHNIPSYFIKTIFLWKIEQEEPSMWKHSLNFSFMEMLETYKKCMEAGEIPYYWNKNYNLLQNVKSVTLVNIKNFLQRMIDMIHDKIKDDVYITAKFLLPKHEYTSVYYYFNPTLIPESARWPLTADEILYAKFEKELNRPYESRSTFKRFIICVAIFLGLYYLTKRNV